MADCDDRQLSEAQRQAGYQNQRTGVMQAVRPFSGRPSLDNLIDYINRELYPAVRATRNKVNDVYLPVVDNAPSGNPLSYYFSTETGAADPTAGRIRLNASPENTATVMRVSELNARLADARPWLEVMAGGATAPLGVVTLSDVINPTRFIRFNLNTMTDQGGYWDLGVTPIESSHVDPFVDGSAVALAFIPGVASSGATVPPGGLSPMGANTVLGNPTAATAPPVAIAIADSSVLGRAGIAGTGNIESITVPGTGTFTGESVFLRSSSIRGFIQWRNFTLVDLPLISNNRFVGNITGATARPVYTDLANLATDLFGIGWDSTTHSFRLTDAADNTFLANMTGATTFPRATPLSDLDSVSITYENVGKSFVREALTGDVTALQNNNTVTINANAISDAKLRDSGPLSVIGNATALTADPADISAVSGSGAVLRESGATLGFGTIATAGLADNSVTDAKLRDSAGTSVIGRSAATSGDPADITATTNDTILRRNTVGVLDWGRIRPGMFDGSSDVPVSSVEDIAALSVIGRSANSTGVPAAIAATAASDAVLRESGSVLGFGTIATAGITNNAVTDAKLRQGGALSVIGRSANSTGNVADISATAASGAVLRESGSTIGFGTIATTGLADDSVTDAKLRNSAALSVIGRSANSSGDPADITAVAASGSVLRESGSTLGFGQIATAGITDAAVTLAKMANLTQGTVIGRQNTAGTGVPQALTGTQLGENVLMGTIVVDSTVTGTQTAYSFPAPNNCLVVANTTVTFQGIAARASGTVMFLRHGGTGSTTIQNESVSASGVDQLSFGAIGTPDLVLTDRQQTTWVYQNSKWRLFGISIYTLQEDKGDITVTGARGQTWTIDNDVVSDAKLRNSAGLSVIGRAVNSTGDPADITAVSGSNNVLVESGGVLAWGLVTTLNILDNTIANADLRQSGPLSVIGRTNNTTGNVADISATAGSDAVLRENGSTLAFGQITTGGIADDAITNGKLRNGGALSVIGRSANSTGDVADISATAATDAVLRESGSTLGFGTIATGGIANNAVTDAKLRDSGALSVIGRSANSTGDPADISGTASSDAVLRISGTSLGFGTVATAGIANNAVTNAKLAQMAQSTIKGRAAGAGTGDPTDLTASQVVDIIETTVEGRVMSWSAEQDFLGPAYFSGMIRLDGLLSSSEGSSIDNKTIGQINLWRLNPTVSPLLLNGMTAVADGQFVWITNTSTTNTIQVTDEGSTTAAARFALGTTAILIEPLRAYAFWYDGTDDRWKGFGNYPT